MVASEAGEALLPVDILACCDDATTSRREWRSCRCPIVVGCSRQDCSKRPVRMMSDDALQTSHVSLNIAVVLLVAAVFYLPTAVSSRTLATQMSPYVVETQYGRLRGVLVALPGGLGGRGQSRSKTTVVEAFLGLQYASLLGGELRFMPPTSSMEKWDGVRVALKFRPVCPQRVPDVNRLQRDVPTERVDHIKRLLPFLDKQNEECLNLNVYVPARGTPQIYRQQAAF